MLCPKRLSPPSSPLPSSVCPLRATSPASERMPEKQPWTSSTGAIPGLQPLQSPGRRWLPHLDSFLCGLS